MPAIIKMRTKKQLTLMLAAVMALTALGGCGTKKKEEESETVRLKYIMPGPGKQQDSDKVWAKFNEELQKKIPGVAVDFEIIPIAEYNNKFMLMVAGRENIDIANTYGLNFSEEVINGTFAPLDELMEEYGKELSESLDSDFMDYMRYDGTLYGIPTYQMLCVPSAYIFPKALVENYMDEEAFKAELYGNVHATDKLYNIVEDYLENLKQAGKINDGPKPYLLYDKGYETIVNNYVISYDNAKVEYIFDTDAYRKYIKYAKDWKEKGYYREDLSTTDEWNVYKEDGWVMWSGNYEPWYDEQQSKALGFEVKSIPTNDKYYIPMSPSAGGTGILSSSKHKELAMQVINLIQTDKELYNLLVHGFEGEHYKKVGDDRIETNLSSEYATANDKYGLWKWVVGNAELDYQNQYQPDGYKEWVFDEINSPDYKSMLIGFHPDLESVSDILTQVSAIQGEYKGSNRYDDYDEWMSKLSIAGNQKVIDELQRQVDEFLASKDEQ